MKVLVTGGAGFIGREAVRKLIDNCYTVIAYDLAEQVVRQKDYFNSLDENQLTIKCGSILDRTALRAAFQDVDIVLHLAAMLGVRRTEENQLACLESNITGTDNVLNACASHDVKKVIVEISEKMLGVTAVVENDEIVGIITDGDLRRMLTKTDSFVGLTAKDIMTHNPKKIANNAMAVEAMEMMDNYGITQILAEENGRYSGVVHIHNLSKEGII